MAEIRVKENETLDSALRRFKKSCARSGVLSEVKKREQYDKPSVKKKKKSPHVLLYKANNSTGPMVQTIFVFPQIGRAHV